MAGDLSFYDDAGVQVGELTGYTVKRATRAALLSAVEGVNELLYEVAWRDRALPPGMPSADFLAAPAAVGEDHGPFTDYLAAEGVGADDRAALLADLELLSHAYALATLDRLGWRRTVGESVDSDALRQGLKIGPEHQRLFGRMLEMLDPVRCAERRGWRLRCPGRDRGNRCRKAFRTTRTSSRAGWRRATRTDRPRSACSGAAQTPCPTC